MKILFKPSNKKDILLLFLIVITLFTPSFICYSQKIIYFDPSSSSATQDGSLTNPYKSFDIIDNVKVSFVSGNIYAVKRGSRMNVTKRIFVRPANITIRAYGTGARPVIISSVSSKEKILDVSLTSNFTIRDIELMAEDTALTVINIQGSPNTKIINCKLHEAFYGLRNIDSRNKVFVDSVEIFNIQQDGVYFNGADSVIIQNSHIHHINQAWFKYPTEQGSYGDAIQLDAAKYFYIGNNILDRSDTGNKFCFITGSGPCPGSIFEKNKCYGSPTLGAHMYNINTQGLIIRYNLFDGGARGIYGTALNTKIYYNIFNNLSECVFGQITKSNQEFYNNVFANCKMVLSSWSDVLTVKNNIFYKVTQPFQGNNINEEYNIYHETGKGLVSFIVSTLSRVTDPMFEDAGNGNFHIKTGSPALNSGVNVNIPKVDFSGNIYSSTEKVSIGSYQDADGGSTISIPRPSGQTAACASASTSYSTTGVTQATTYAWKISPSNAGILTTNGKSVTIAWSNNFTGAALLSYDVTGNNNFSGSSPTLTVNVAKTPSAPNKPTGTTTFTQGAQTISYNTNSITNASSYNWSINPTSAGSFTGTTASSNLAISAAFTGTANITVRAVNSCGASAWSEPLTINVSQATTAIPIPAGNTKPCQNTTTTYTTTGVTLASTYSWKISPSNAGVLTNNGKTVTVAWNNSFTGTASLAYDVTGNNNYKGTSPTLTITVAKAPTVPNKPSGVTTITQGGQTISYNTNTITNASGYNWNINPTSAGSLSGTTATASFTLASSFTGTANITVRTTNSCGTSAWSEPLTITVTALAPELMKPSGNVKPCAGSQVAYSAANTIQNTNYTWKVSPVDAGNVVSNGNSASIVWNKGFSGNAMVYYETSGGSGISTSPQLSVSVAAFPSKPDKPFGETLLNQGEQTLTYYISSIANATEYQWGIKPANAGTLTVNYNYADLKISKNFFGNIQLSVQTKNNCGISDESEALKIEVKEEQFSIPSFFTPNGDGKDDTWNIPILAKHPDAEIKVYDISGRLVKSFYGYDLGWDGYINGRPAHSGVYTYIIYFKDGMGFRTGKLLLGK